MIFNILEIVWVLNNLAGTISVNKIIFYILIEHDMALYNYHNLLTGIDSFYDSHNVEELKMKFQAHLTEI